ncbi:MAG: CARDB domain-containing protein [Candidatus Thermoplasmatota archaeon]|nr:CARDB domain-containing protein [Candidatus Thermoplasmatota archaeon]
MSVNGKGLKRYVQVTLVALMVLSTFAVLIYNMPFGSSAGAYDVSVSVDNASKEVSAGSSVTYQLTIKNEGTNADRYDLNMTISRDPSTWQATLSQTSTGQINSGSTLTGITVQVRAPSSNVTINSYCYVTIKVISQADAKNSTASVLLTTLLKRTYGVSITSPGIKYVDPGASTTYSFSVKNEGNDQDGYTLETVSVPSGFSASVDFDTGKFAPGATKAATMTLQTPSSALAQSYQIIVKASSVTDNATSATRTITAIVNQTHKLSISSDGVKEADITTTRVVQYGIRLTNLGNGEDQFSLSYYIPSQYITAGWSGDISTTTTSKVQPDNSANVTFYAYTPTKSNNPAVSSRGEFFINATSVGDNTVTRSVKVSCVVLPYYDIEIQNNGPSTKSVDPDGSITFDFTVKNTGNDQDTFYMDLAYPNGFQDSSIEPSTLSLAAQASGTVTVTVNPDEMTVKAKSYRFTLYANSTNGPSVNSVFFVSINRDYGIYLEAPTGATIPNGQPAQTYKFPVRLQNKGNGVDTFDLSVAGETSKIDMEWTPLISATVTPQVQSDSTFEFNVTVSAPSNATMGTYRFRVDATSNGGSTTKVLWLSVRIPQLYNVDIGANKESLRGEYSNSTGPAVKVVYLLDVYNKGSGEDDSITLSVKEAPQEFVGRYSIFFTENSKNKITIPSAGSKQANLEIETPTVSSGVLAGTYTFKVEVTSNNGTQASGDDKRAEISLSLLLQPKHDVRILTGVNSSQVRMGGSVNFTVIIQNRGTVNDYYQLSYEYPNYGQNVKFSIPDDNLTTRILKPLEQESIVLTATILPGTNPSWGSVWVKISATHPTDFTIKDEKYFTAIFADDFSGDLSTTSNFRQASPGEKAWFNVTLKNTGTRSQDTFTVEFESALDFENVQISPSSVTIAPNQVTTISINISIPAIQDKIIESGTYELTLKATSKGETNMDSDDIIVDTLTLKLKVMPVYRVQLLIPQGSAQSDVGKTLPPIKLNVTNNGNEPSTIQVSLHSSTPTSIRSWVTISPSTVSALGPRLATDVTATIRVPSNALAGKQTFTFQADVSGQTASSMATFELIVNDAFKLELTVPDGTLLKEAEPKDTVDFNVKLTNKGNTPDSVDIELASSKRNWATFGFKNGTVLTQETTVYNLGREVARDIWLNIEVEESAPAGEQTFTIKAISKGDNAITASITLRVDVAANRMVELVTNEDTKDLVPDVDREFTEITYSVQVVNKGEGPDSFKVEVIGPSTSHPHLDQSTWDAMVKSEHPNDVILSKVKTGQIPKGGQETITVTVRVQKSWSQYSPGDIYSSIWAISEGDTGTADDKYSQPLVLVTKVKQAYGASLSVVRDLVETRYKADDVSMLTAEFTVRVQNTGNDVDSYKLEIKSSLNSNDFPIKPSADSIEAIAPNEYGTLTVTVEMKADTPKGRYSFEVRWISRGDDLEYVTTEDYVTSWKTLTFDVIQTYGVSIDTVTEQKDADVGTNVEYKLTVKNLGNNDDNFRIEIRNDRNLNWATTSKTRFTLGGIGTQTQETEIIIKVSIPRDNRDAMAGSYFFNVSVIRDQTQRIEQQKATDHIVLRVDVNERYSHLLESDDDMLTVEPGQQVTYRFKVTNRGNVDDYYDLEVKGNRKEWGKLSTSRVYIKADEQATVYLNVTVPSSADVNDMGDIEARKYDFLVSVRSVKDRDSIAEELTFTTDVQQMYGVSVPPLDEGASRQTPRRHNVNSRDTLTIRFQVENTGNKDDTFFIQKPTTLPVGWTVDLSSTRVTVPLGDERTVTVTVRFTSDQNFAYGIRELRFQVIPDDGSLIGKRVKSDVSIFIDAQAPDLVIDDSSFSQVPDSSQIKIGTSNTIRIGVKNVGTVAANDVTVRLLVNDREVGSETKSIGVNSTQVFDFKWTPSAGSYTLKVVANDGFVLVESDQDNNEAMVTRELSQFSLNNSLIFYILLAVIGVLILILIVFAFLFMNKNREAKELADRIRAGDIGVDKGGPRKVVKEGAGTPVPPKGPAGLPPSGPAALGPAKEASAPQKKEPVRVKCPECNTEQVFSITQRPSEVKCKTCGVLMRIPEKKR